jgi:small subunit ribosomal protein S6
MLIFSPVLKEDDLNSENDKVLDLVKSLGGEVIKTDIWGKRSLAYEIDRKREGYYFINYFRIATEKIAELENYYKLNDNILRYNVLRNDEE